MPRLRFELKVTSIDNEPAFDPLWTVGLLNLPKIDGSFKTGFVYNVEKKAQQLFSDLLLATGAFDRPYQPVPELPKGPVMTVAALDKVLEAQRIQAELEKQYRLAQQLGPAYMPGASSSSASGPVYAAPNGWRAENKEEAKERMHKAQLEEYVKAGLRSHPTLGLPPVQLPSSCGTGIGGWGPIEKDWGPPPGFPPEHPAKAKPPFPGECDCGGPKGHVPGGFHCRK